MSIGKGDAAIQPAPGSGADPSGEEDAGSNREFIVGLGRAFAGALLFSLPMLMTMELWWLGFYLDSWRVIVLLVVTLPLLVGLSRFAGFRPTERLRDGIADAGVALLVSAIASIVTLFLFDLLTLDMSAREIIGKIVLQTVPGSIGAMLARSQLGGQADDGEEKRKEEPGYWGELFLMAVGALFLSLNVAPTEEMILIAFKMSIWQEIALVVLSVLLMHAFVYSVNFHGGISAEQYTSFFNVFARFTITGYAIVLLISLAVLWMFGRTDGTSLQETLNATIVLAFPGAIGAAAARLVL